MNEDVMFRNGWTTKWVGIRVSTAAWNSSTSLQNIFGSLTLSCSTSTSSHYINLINFSTQYGWMLLLFSLFFCVKKTALMETMKWRLWQRQHSITVVKWFGNLQQFTSPPVRYASSQHSSERASASFLFDLHRSSADNFQFFAFRWTSSGSHLMSKVAPWNSALGLMMDFK